MIDGVAPDIGDRVLLHNGLYNVISKGNRNQSWILQKTNDVINRDVLIRREECAENILFEQ